MLDKLKLNNLIISNAKVIQKVRIQIVRKIIQRMRKLKMLLEKRSDDQSSAIKLRKCVAIVDAIKKMKREDVIRNIILLDDKTAKKIVTNSGSTPEEVAIAMLAQNKTMQGLIERLRQELNYSDENADNWKKTLLEMVKIKAKKQRRKKRAEHNEKMKEPKKKSNSTLVKRSNKNFAANDDDYDDDAIDKSNIKVMTVEKKESKKAKKLEKTKQIDAPLPKSETKVKESCDPAGFPIKAIVKESKLRHEKANDDKSKSKKTSKKDDFKAIQITKDEKIKEAKDDSEAYQTPKFEQSKVTKEVNKKRKNNKIIMSSDDDDDDDAKRPEAIKFMSGYSKFEVIPNKLRGRYKFDAPEKVDVVDPFFITSTGDRYIASVTKRAADDDDDEQEDNSKKISNEMATNYYPTTAKFKTNVKDKRNEEENLHPSWNAKKKLNSIADFRGKKIIFDDDTDTPREIISFNKSTNKMKEKSSSSENLHPSWEAKKKMKPAITAFQGKKIKFEDNE